MDKASDFGFERVNSDESITFVDQRFFWNKHALDDLLNKRCFNMSCEDAEVGDDENNASDEYRVDEEASRWIMPMVQVCG